ncbi:cell division cycle, cofactor of APC complex-like isoform X1 [Pelobates cultripes]|uniref:Cell division cycle, cofactor of APC complex-like isoform X1 n=1 Tax=Pelobates cultripes TaxID=61616 RepID=A0AAD1R8X7_PELCU|nr:cell division cycle, cofactor of APC complex-like isoform X1 [Pelobates cultripes]
MSRRRLEEAILKSRELGSSDGEESEKYSELFVRHRVQLAKDPHSIYSLCFSPSGKQLSVGFGNGAIQILNVEDGQVDKTLYSGSRKRLPITALQYHPRSENLLVAAGADGLVSIYDIKSEINVFSITELENEINALDFCMDGSVYATAGKDKKVRLYDSHTNEVLNIFEAPEYFYGDDVPFTSGHTRRIFALKFHPSENHIFLTGGWDDSIKVWDKRMAKEARRVIDGPHICGPGIDIKDNKIITASWVSRNALQLWDFRTGNHLHDLPFPTTTMQGEFLYAAKFCTDSIVLAGGSGTCTACAINLNTQEILGDISLLNKPVQTVDAACGDRLVAVAGVAGNLHIAELC